MRENFEFKELNTFQDGGTMQLKFKSLSLGGIAFLLLGSASTSYAADLGGDCCSDLEERVAVLEATTARKGNRKVSLVVSGSVNTAIFAWDDGIDSDVYVGDDNSYTISNVLRFHGSAKINSEWTAGYKIAIDILGDGSGGAILGINQANDDASLLPGINQTESYMYVESKQLGRLSWGFLSGAADNSAALVDPSGSYWASLAPIFRGQGFFLRNSNGATYNNTAGLTGTASTVGSGTNLNWGDFAQCQTLGGVGVGTDCNGLSTNGVLYDSPVIAGFQLSVGWGEDDYLDVALKYNNTINDFLVSAAAAYTDNSDNNSETEYYQVQVGFLHQPTGIFAIGSYGNEVRDTFNGTARPVGMEKNAEAYWFKAGIKQQYNSLGKTAIFADYGEYKDQFGVNIFNAGVTGSTYSRYGVGINQWIDAASMQIYGRWVRFELDVEGTGAVVNDLNNAEDLDLFVLGGVIFF